MSTTRPRKRSRAMNVCGRWRVVVHCCDGPTTARHNEYRMDLPTRRGKGLGDTYPFTEPREILGGNYIILDKDQTEALEIAAQHSGARVGAVDVRQIFVLATSLENSWHFLSAMMPIPSIANRLFHSERRRFVRHPILLKPQA